MKTDWNMLDFRTKNLPLWCIILIFHYSCSNLDNASHSGLKLDQPNILWLIAEDMSPYLASFGDSTVHTPNLDRLAAEGVRYTHVFSPSGVCAPSRAALATGMYPSSIGANHMRTHSHTEITGLAPYEAVPPAEVKMFNELLRMHGYYCTNNSKEDYQFQAPVTAWDENGPFGHWRNRKPSQPFFSVFSFITTHESGLFEPYGILKNERRLYQAGDTTFQLGHPYAKMTQEESPIHISPDTKFPIPPYLPDNEIVRRDLWKMYNNIVEMDQQIGAILNQLEEDGILEETIIFFFSDHGGPLPRQKRLVYDAGLQVPLIIRYPEKFQAGGVDDQLISFVDFAPTVLEMAGLPAPAYMQGQSFFGEENKERQYIHAAADRFDGMTDVIRAVRNKRYKYIRNYRPQQGYYLPIKFRERIPTMQELIRLRDTGELNEVQALWFRNEKTPEELYDCNKDPHELHNLAGQANYQEELAALRLEMDNWLQEINDHPELPEEELIEKLWQGANVQPQTADPVVSFEEGKLSIHCDTKGAAIGYRVMEADSKAWEVYSSPFEGEKGQTIEVQAHRIGFKPSHIISFIPK